MSNAIALFDFGTATTIAATLSIGIGTLVYILPKILMRQKLNRFSASKTPKGVVILHGTKRTQGIPAASPFVLKLETFLRISKIPYEYDGNLANSLGPKGKTPWISFNGEHLSDSQICIEYLNKKFQNPIKPHYSSKNLAIARMVRTLLEDKIYWELLLWAFVWTDGDGPRVVRKFLNFPYLLVKYFNYSYTKLAWAQGIGRHDKETVKCWLMQDIQAISDTIGENQFLLGDEVCEEDACVFGFLAQLIWGYQSFSHHAKLIREQCPNIVAYCNRMKILYYPDWDQLLLP